MTLAKTSAALGSLIEDIRERKQEVNFVSQEFADEFTIAPGRITVLGAPPGAGKTCLASQLAFSALESFPTLNLIVANAEMDIQAILRREISRRSGIAHKRILEARFDDAEFELLLTTCSDLAKLTPRVRHMVTPFSVQALGELLELPPGLLVCDYIQKFRSPERDVRSGVDEVVGCLRSVAMHGWAILAISALARPQGGYGSKETSLSSFRDSSGIEYEADLCYLLEDQSKDQHARVKELTLRCVKNRSGFMSSTSLVFCGDYMRFERRDPVRHAELDDFNSGGFVTGFPE